MKVNGNHSSHVVCKNRNYLCIAFKMIKFQIPVFQMFHSSLGCSRLRFDVLICVGGQNVHYLEVVLSLEMEFNDIDICNVVFSDSTALGSQVW